MSQLPLPRALAELLEPRGGDGNRSLLFDRGFDGYSPAWTIDPAERKRFLEQLVKSSAEEPPWLEERLERRARALKLAGVERRLRLHAQVRVVVGLGLPSPFETGFLFDRLTGCPYLPGSSVKGLARAAAGLAADGELEVGEEPEAASAFWQQQVERIFGAEARADATPARGRMVFYDAFPTAWPRLELDVLTPHHGGYSVDPEVAPADWHQPVPVLFLALAPGTTFDFPFRGADPDTREDDEAKTEALLTTALDWLGIGGKKSSGYGLFGPEPVVSPAEQQPAKARTEDPPEPPKPAVKETVWTNASLELHQGRVAATRGKKDIATCERRGVEPKLLKLLKKRRDVKADVAVVKLTGGSKRLEKILQWKEEK